MRRAGTSNPHAHLVLRAYVQDEDDVHFAVVTISPESMERFREIAASFQEMRGRKGPSLTEMRFVEDAEVAVVPHQAWFDETGVGARAMDEPVLASVPEDLVNRGLDLEEVELSVSVGGLTWSTHLRGTDADVTTDTVVPDVLEGPASI